MRLRERVALVTGATRGIGRATALACAREGARVAVLGIDAADGAVVAEACREHGAEAVWVGADLASERAIQEGVAEIAARLGDIDVLVNNAGIYRKGTVVDTSLETWEQLLRVNLTGAFLCAKHVLPSMLERGRGSIVNVASEAGLVGIAEQTAYNVSKAALISLTQSMAVDFARRGVRVNCVCPGTTLTPLVEEAVAREADPSAALRRLEGMRPLDRLGRPEEIAEAIVFLASDAAGYATGAVLSVDGGYTAQ
jgi:NAD(P)-dependent dehydrogenase (short-subunit alcohol dehydrogenase family)